MPCFPPVPNLCAATIASAVALILLSTNVQAAERGLLLLAHGQHVMGGDHAGHAGHPDAPEPIWNQNVNAVARGINASIPVEVAFGMAETPAIQAAITKLEARGVTEITAIPLFISSHSPIIGNFKYILGLSPTLAATTSLKHLDKANTKAKVTMTSAMDAHPIVSEILLDRALANAQGKPATTTVVLIAHGPNDDGENKLWVKDLETHAAFLKQRGGFRDVKGMTRRDDADPNVKARALAEFRALVQAGIDNGQVVVVPVVLSEGGIEGGLKQDLQGLNFTFAKPLLPDPKVADWVKKQAAQP